jgi:DNA anti-recombination protein RmuC
MNVIAIDTLEVMQELKAAGFTEAQAESVTRIVRRAQDVDLSALSSKNDLAGMKSDLQLSLAELELKLAKVQAELQRDLTKIQAELQRDLTKIQAELQRDLAEVKRDLSYTKTELLKWIIGSLGVQTIVILGAVVALARAISH